MAKTWHSIRIFISSTFRDMHSERDQLVRFVFPELKERCRAYRIHLIDVDLRWGITESDAKDGRALGICLDEIDSCRPYFLGLLGHCYGTIPTGETESITAQEIFHGVLHNDVPRQVADLRRIINGKLEGRSLASEQVECLVRCYQWDADKGNYQLRDGVTDSDLDIICSVFKRYSTYQRDRSFFFFRSESLTRRLGKASAQDFFETDMVAKEKLALLKREIVDAGLPWFDYDDIEAFGERVKEVLWKQISGEFGREIGDIERDWIEEESELHEYFVENRTRQFVGRQDVLSRMRDFCEKETKTNVMLVTGEPGCGKSSLMSKFYKDFQRDYPDWFILSHFVGASPDSTNLRNFLRRLCTLLWKQLDGVAEVPDDIKKLKQVFSDWIKRVAKEKRVLIIVDAVNQLEKTYGAHALQWIPQNLPHNVRFVISTLAGETYDALKMRRTKPDEIRVVGLEEEETRKLVALYLEKIRKSFPNKNVEKAFYEKIRSGNPLYILVALEELRVFGDFHKLGDRIKRLPEGVFELFTQVLERMEHDFPRELVSECLALIACGRQGMTASELQTLLRHCAPTMPIRNEASRLPDMTWARLYRALGAYLIERSGVIAFFHDQLREAAHKRYLKTEDGRNRTHARIADYFENRWSEPYIRALGELPYQRTKASDWKGVERVLCDLRFIEAKCAAGMTYELIADYDYVLAVLPDAREDRQKQAEHRRRLNAYVDDSIRYVKGTIENLDIISSLKPWSEEEHRAEVERITGEPTRADRLRIFSQFVALESHTLGEFAGIPGLCIQQAYNYACTGPVSAAATSIIKSEPEKPAILKRPEQRPKLNPHRSLIRTLQKHTSWVTSVCVTPKGDRIVSGGWDQAIRVWDVETGECLFSFEDRIEEINSVSVSADGRRLVSGGWGRVVQVWDLQNRECLFTLAGHTDWITTVSIVPDGTLAISGSRDRSIRVWSLENRRCVKVLKGHTKSIESTYVTGNGRMLITGCQDHTVGIWDLVNGTLIRMLKGHSEGVGSVCATPDGRIALSGSQGCTVRVWDIERGECIRVLKGHTESVESVCITSDGKLAISGGQDCVIRVWDIEQGECIKVFSGHSEGVEGICLTPDGRVAVSASQDSTIKVWNITTGRDMASVEKHAGAVESVDVTPDGKIAVSGGRDWAVKVWAAQKGKLRRTLTGHENIVKSVRLSACGKRAVSGSWDKTLRVWDVETGEHLRSMKGSKLDFENMSLSPDGKEVLDRALHVWDLDSGTCLRTGSSLIRQSGAFAVLPDGKTIATGSDDHAIRIWDLQSNKCLRILKGHTDEVTSVSITPDAQWALSGSKDKTVRMWDLQKGICLKTIGGHKDDITSVSISPDARVAVSGSWDCTLRLWDLTTTACIAILPTNSEVTALSRMAAGAIFVCGTNAGEVILLTVTFHAV